MSFFSEEFARMNYQYNSPGIVWEAAILIQRRFILSPLRHGLRDCTSSVDVLLRTSITLKASPLDLSSPPIDVTFGISIRFCAILSKSDFKFLFLFSGTTRNIFLIGDYSWKSIQEISILGIHFYLIIRDTLSPVFDTLPSLFSTKMMENNSSILVSRFLLTEEKSPQFSFLLSGLRIFKIISEFSGISQG
ncbi:hypothetical protein Tco_1328683 [Tanacetum coccineum]